MRLSTLAAGGISKSYIIGKDLYRIGAVGEEVMILLIPAVMGLLLAGFWLWMIIDLANNEYLSTASKNNWFLALILLNFFGALWYYLVEYRPRNL